MKRILLGVVMMAMAAALAAPAAMGQAKTLPEGCTFERGETTCETTVETHEETERVIPGQWWEPCVTDDGRQGSRLVLPYTDTTTVYGETTTDVYQGWGTHKHVSSEVTYSGPLYTTSTSAFSYGPCHPFAR